MRSVADALEVTLLGGDRQTRGTSAVVYDLYLQGQHFGELRSNESLERAVKYLEEALALDPAYAPAWEAICFRPLKSELSLRLVSLACSTS